MIQADEITTVIQGGNYNGVTERIVAGVRKHLPGAQVIYSTCDQDVPKSLKICDRIIISEDPGSFAYENRPAETENNVNRQIVNTLAALKEVQTPYVLKMRSDFFLTGHGFLTYFDQFPGSEEGFRVFKHKVLNCCYFARNPEARYHYPLHPSDLAFFGYTEDLKLLFEIPLMTREQAYWNLKDRNPYQYTAEQYIFLSCLQKTGHRFDCAYYNDCRPVNIEQTKRYFASNFVFLSFEQFNIQPHKRKFSMQRDPQLFRTCYTHVEWMHLYRKYVNPAQEVPKEDAERGKIEKFYRRYKKCRFVANLFALPFRTKALRRRVRNGVLDFLLNRACHENGIEENLSQSPDLTRTSLLKKDKHEQTAK